MPARARSFVAAAFGAAFGFAAGAAATLAVGTVPASLANRDAAVCPYAGGVAKEAWTLETAPRGRALPGDLGVLRADRSDGASRCPYLSGRAALPSGSGEAGPERRCPYASGAGRGASAPGQVSPD